MWYRLRLHVVFISTCFLLMILFFPIFGGLGVKLSEPGMSPSFYLKPDNFEQNLTTGKNFLTFGRSVQYSQWLLIIRRSDHVFVYRTFKITPLFISSTPFTLFLIVGLPLVLSPFSPIYPRPIAASQIIDPFLSVITSLMVRYSHQGKNRNSFLKSWPIYIVFVASHRFFLFSNRRFNGPFFFHLNLFSSTPFSL